MPNVALFVDLPNFYSRLLKSRIEEPQFLRDYFLYWLDFDLLAINLTGSFIGIWIFYSGERIGPSSERITGNHLKDYMKRINALEGVTADNVNIPGEQREPITYICDKCGNEGETEAKSEKGIDASLTVHLFDTMESWDVAYLLSGDADFVPVVASLRRSGKIVIGAGFSDASPALVRECYNYVNLGDVFLRKDVALYTIFKENGIAQKWLIDEVCCDPAYVPPHTVELRVGWSPRRAYRSDNSGSIRSPIPTGPIIFYDVFFGGEGPIDVSGRDQLIAQFKAQFANEIEITDTSDQGFQLTFKAAAWESAQRRLQKFISSIEGLTVIKTGSGGELYSRKYQYNQDTKKYEFIVDDSQ